MTWHSKRPGAGLLGALALVSLLLVSAAASAQSESNVPAERSPAAALPAGSVVETVEPASGEPAPDAPAEPAAAPEAPAAAASADQPEPAAATPAAALPEGATVEGADAPVAGEPAPDLAAISLEDLEALVATLENEQDRTAFLNTLKTLIDVRKGQAPQVSELEGVGTQLIETISDRAAKVGEDLAETAEVLAAAPEALQIAFQGIRDPAQQARWTEILSKLLVVIVAGLIAEWVVAWALRRPRTQLEVRQGGRIALFAFSFLRFLMLLIPIAAFAGAAYGTLSIVEPRFVTRIVAVTVINANIVVRIVMMAARVILAPRVPNLRLIKLQDESAAYWFIWVRRLAILVVYGYLIIEAAYILGLPARPARELFELWGLLVLGTVIMLLMQIRGDVAKLIRGDVKTGHLAMFRRRFGDIWHVIGIVLAIACYVVWSLEIPGGFEFLARAIALSILIIVAVRLANLGIVQGLDRLFALSHELHSKHPLLEKRVNRYLPALKKAAQFVVFVLGVFLLLDTWGLGVAAAFTSPEGKEFVAGLVKIAMVLLIAVITWEVISTLIERSLQTSKMPTRRASRRTRFQTLLPLLRNVVFVTIAVITTITVLSELGVNVGPLIAGAGVVGLAVGFGAQTLVQDIITGIFILLEDAIAVGDVVDVGGHGGVVEGMTIRSVRLRDIAGDVHIVPFSQVNAVLNRTKEFSYALLEIGVAYRENVDEVVETLREVSEGLRADEEYGQDILEPLEVLGLENFGASSVDIRVRLKTIPMRQWAVRREFNRRIKQVFDERGIEIPFPHQTLYFGEDKEGKAPSAHVAVEQVTRRRGETAAAAKPTEKTEEPAATEATEEAAEEVDHGSIDATKAPG